MIDYRVEYSEQNHGFIIYGDFEKNLFHSISRQIMFIKINL